MQQLKQHDLSLVDKSKLDSVRVVRELFAPGGDSIMATEANGGASGLIDGFALGLDMYFIQGKHGPKVKKGLESKLAMTIRTLVEGLEGRLNELIKTKDSLSELF